MPAMHHIVSEVMAWLQAFAQQVPLELFVFVGGIVEEVIAPVPSPLVATLAGGIAKEQGYGWPALFLVCAIGVLGKTIGAYLFYVIIDKFEDVLTPRFGKFLGVSHEEIETFGKRFGGGWKDGVVLFLIRSIPMMPSTPVSMACGLVKLRTRTFLLATYCGFLLREMFFMVLGYSGIAAAGLLAGFSSAEGVINALIALTAFIIIAWLYWRRRKGTLMGLLGKKD